MEKKGGKHRTRFVAACGVLFVLWGLYVLHDLSIASADDAILTSGERFHGKLLQTTQGIAFQVDKAQNRYPLSQLHAVDLSGTAEHPLKSHLLHRLLLCDDQSVSGELIAADNQQITFRLANGTTRKLPRESVQGISQLHGVIRKQWCDFEKDDDTWKSAGAPAVRRDDRHAFSGKYSLLLARAGQKLSLFVPADKHRLRIRLSFYVDDGQAEGRWTLSARFGDDGPVTRHAIAASGNRLFWADEGLPSLDVKSDGQWHQLEWTVTPEATRIYIDDRLVSDGRGNSAGPMYINWSCEKDGRGLWLDDLMQFVEVPERTHRAIASKQDELWLDSGDSVFGNITSAGARSISLNGGFGARTFSWNDVRAIYFNTAAKPHVAEVEITFTAGEDRDRLRGRLRDVTDEFFTLDHADLGEVQIERGRVRRVVSLKAGVPSRVD